MTDAPKWIWAYTGDGTGDRMTDYGTWDIGDMGGIPDCHPHWPHVKYVRADLPPTDERIMAHPKVMALVEALRYAIDYVEGCKVNDLPDLGAASHLPFVDDVLRMGDSALRDLKGSE